MALIQGGVGDGDDLVFLGSLYYEPLWVFTRRADSERLSQLRALRLAVGEEGSGTQGARLTVAD